MKTITKSFMGSAVVLAALFLLSTALYGQTISSSIVGSVVDPSNLPVAGVALELRQVSTGAVRKLSTGADGNFVFSTLVPGEYVLTAEAPGFKKIERKGLMLSASEVLPVGTITLAVGAVTETVTVVSQGALVQTASSERSGVVTSNQVEDLLTKSRNVMSLLALLPGVVDTTPDADSLARGWNLYVQGNRNNTNSMSVDGMVLNSWGLGNATDVAVSQDSIAEVKVLVGNYQAEYGRRSGANITLVSKAGTQ
ncbi:MAG: carboxypeptidase regulatory-like domain-containing protein, partial [Bryobacteraceae bacterium]